MISRRKFNSIALVSPALSLFLSSQVFASNKARSDKVLWGGLGFSVKENEIDLKMPMVSQVFKTMGFPNVVSRFTNQLENKYKGGVAEDPKKLLDGNSDPLLIFLISLDYEQMILVPGQEKLEFQNSYIYATAQVIFFELPRQGASDGLVQILYSLPFRIKSNKVHQASDLEKRQAHFRDLVPELSEYFGTEVASKSFIEAATPKKLLKVNKVSFTAEAATSLKDLEIEGVFDPNFLGQTFSASLAEKGGLSVFPYISNNSIGNLRERFTTYPDISKIFEKHSKENLFDFTFELILHKTLRQSVGSNAANIQYRRGFSVFVKLSENNGKIIFNKKILLLDDEELPKSMLDKLRDYDRRAFVQIAIKLFDDFVFAVMSDDKEKLKLVGLDPAKDFQEAAALKVALLQCKYQKN